MRGPAVVADGRPRQPGRHRGDPSCVLFNPEIGRWVRELEPSRALGGFIPPKKSLLKKPPPMTVTEVPGAGFGAATPAAEERIELRARQRDGAERRDRHAQVAGPGRDLRRFEREFSPPGERRGRFDRGLGGRAGRREDGEAFDVFPFDLGARTDEHAVELARVRGPEVDPPHGPGASNREREARRVEREDAAAQAAARQYRLIPRFGRFDFAFRSSPSAGAKSGRSALARPGVLPVRCGRPRW